MGLFDFFKKVKQDTDSNESSRVQVPVVPKHNDKLIVISGVSYSDLKKVLLGFCKIYNSEAPQAFPRVTRLSATEFAITFPYDMDFEIYCYLINYLYYPMELQWKPEVIAWATPKTGETWVTEKMAGKNCMLFVPTDDSEHDNVYLTTSGNIGYKLGFGLSDKGQLLVQPKKTYVPETISNSDLNDKEYEDFK